MITERYESEQQSRQQDGPPLVLLATVSLLLLIAGIATSAALGGVFPSPFDNDAAIQRYFAEQPNAVLASAVFVFGSTVPLAIYAATTSSRLRTLGVTAPGATIALAGGLISAVMLTLSGLVQWVLSRPTVRTDRRAHRARSARPVLPHWRGRPRRVPRSAARRDRRARPPAASSAETACDHRVVIAIVAEVATVSLIWPAASVLLPIARFPGLIWLVVTGLLLPHRRPRRKPDTRISP
ncbi:MAG: hypothetical protein ACRDTA_29435 [Pseudonocardiaceae bacterium]